MNSIRTFIQNAFRKWWFRVFVGFIVCVSLLFAFRHPLFRKVGRYLNASDELVQTDAYFILGGNSYDRGKKAFDVYTNYPEAHFVATGGNYPLQIRALDITMKEAELTRHWLIRQGVPENQIDTLCSATSTYEESIEILRYCESHNFTTVTLISSSFHLRRMRMVFEKKFRKEGIQTYFLGAGDEEFRQDEWWRDEQSIVNVNNELVKIVYYWLKY